MNEKTKSYSKSLTQVDEFLSQQEEQLAQAKEHRENMISKIEELKEMLEIDDTEVSSQQEPEVAPV